MNNLKFRAWHKEHEKYCQVEEIRFDKKELVLSYYIFTFESVFDEVTIEQYTGLKDKNGVEIFEGDILYFEPHKTHSNDRVVEHIDGAYRGRLIRNGYSKLLAECVYETKIIGNIHEDKEMLK